MKITVQENLRPALAIVGRAVAEYETPGFCLWCKAASAGSYFPVEATAVVDTGAFDR